MMHLGIGNPAVDPFAAADRAAQTEGKQVARTSSQGLQDAHAVGGHLVDGTLEFGKARQERRALLVDQFLSQVFHVGDEPEGTPLLDKAAVEILQQATTRGIDVGDAGEIDHHAGPGRVLAVRKDFP